MTNTISKDAAAAVMANLRERGEFCRILAHEKTDHPAWAPPDLQDAIEHRIAQVIDDIVGPRIVELLEANNREVAARRMMAASLRVNILLLAPQTPHDEIDALISKIEKGTVHVQHPV